MMADAQSLSLDHVSEQLDWGDSVVLSATLSPATIDSPKINWAASPEGIVSLHVLTNAEGKSTCQVKWNSPGKAVVTAFVGNVSAKCSFITTSYNLFDIAEGDTVLMDEGGNVAEFIVAKHNYESELNGAGRTLLVRKHYAAIREWDSSWSTYASSSIDTWLNNDYLKLFSNNQKLAMSVTSFYYTPGFSASDFSKGSRNVSVLSRTAFLLSAHEFGWDCKGNDVQNWTKNSPDYSHNEGTTLSNAPEILQTMISSDTPSETSSAFSYYVFTRTPMLYSAEFASGYPSDIRKDYLARMIYFMAYSTFDSPNIIGLGTPVDNYTGSNFSHCTHPAFTVPETTQLDANGKLVF